MGQDDANYWQQEAEVLAVCEGSTFMVGDIVFLGYRSIYLEEAIEENVYFVNETLVKMIYRDGVVSMNKGFVLLMEIPAKQIDMGGFIVTKEADKGWYIYVMGDGDFEKGDLVFIGEYADNAFGVVNREGFFGVGGLGYAMVKQEYVMAKTNNNG